MVQSLSSSTALILLLLSCLTHPTLQEEEHSRSDGHERRDPNQLVPSRKLSTSARWVTAADASHDRRDRERRHGHHPSDSHRLRTRSPDDNQPPPSGISKACSTYYSANTNHAVCNGDRSVMCIAGCTGGIVAQDCRSNATSSPTTQTCDVAFSQTSDSAYLCNTLRGAYTCFGPHSGEISCHQCIPTPNGVLPANVTAGPDSTPNSDAGSSNNATRNEHDQDGSSSDSSTIIPPYFVLLRAPFLSPFMGVILIHALL